MRIRQSVQRSLIALAVSMAASLTISETALARVLPDACGNDTIKFNARTDKGAPAVAAADSSMARVIFVQVPELGECIGCALTTRVGMDGAWVGADHNKSYFALDVAPGEHHLCANIQSRIGYFGKLVAMSSFTAEAGKTYYFKLEPEDHNRNLPLGEHEAPRPDWRLNFAPLSEDEGRYALKTIPLSTAMPDSKS